MLLCFSVLLNGSLTSSEAKSENFYFNSSSPSLLISFYDTDLLFDNSWLSSFQLGAPASLKYEFDLLFLNKPIGLFAI